MKISDLKGRRFGRLTVIAYLEKNRHRKAVWACKCDCGASIDVVGSSLVSGNTASCGCLHMDKVTSHGHARTNSQTREYRIWRNMRSRCENSSAPDWPSYGGRGIKVCDRWIESFENFLADMGLCPFPDCQIDRIDNNGDYRPENCRWADRAQQNSNKRTNRDLTHNGETLCVTEWAKRLHIHPATLFARISAGLSTEEVLTKPVRRRSKSTA